MIATAAADVAAILAGLSGPAALAASLGAFRNARQANNAVNHRKPDEPRLVDLVVSQAETTARIETKLDLHLAQPANIAHRSDPSSGW